VSRSRVKLWSVSAGICAVHPSTSTTAAQFVKRRRSVEPMARRPLRAIFASEHRFQLLFLGVATLK